MLTPAAYYRLVAQPTAQEFFKDNGSVRRAMLACMAVLHVVDHVVQNRVEVADRGGLKSTDKEVQRIVRDLTERHFPFAVVRSYGLASKHARIGLSRDTEMGFDSGRGINRPPSFAGRFMPGRTLLGDKVGGITVRWSERGHVNLTKAIRALLPILEAEFPEILFEA